MNLENIVRYILVAYLICGALNALAALFRVAERVDLTPQDSTPRVIARMVYLTLLGFLPAIPHVWQFISSLPTAFKLEWLDARARAAWRREEKELFALKARRNLSTYDPRDRVEP